MRAYQRPDGMYDVYDVEPKVITAEEYSRIQKQKELENKRASLLAAKATIDSELSQVNLELDNLNKSQSEVVKQDDTSNSTEPVSAEGQIVRKRW